MLCCDPVIMVRTAGLTEKDFLTARVTSARSTLPVTRIGPRIWISPCTTDASAENLPEDIAHKTKLFLVVDLF